MVFFRGFNCEVRRGSYQAPGRRIALYLVDVTDKEIVARATVNIPEISLGPNEVIIKNYSENEGMLPALINAGVVRDTGKRVESRFVEFPICEYLEIKSMNEIS
jgi:hypothetical protein